MTHPAPDLPEAVVARLAQLTEAPARHGLLTAGTWPVGALGHAATDLPLWLVLTDHRAWVLGVPSTPEALAALPGALLDRATWWTAAPGGLRLDKGWTTDAVVLGPLCLPLRTGSRRAARALLRAWEATAEASRAASHGTRPRPPVPPRPAAPPQTPPASRRGVRPPGADTVPRWLVDAVDPGQADPTAPGGPRRPDEHRPRWLLALHTASSHRLGQPDGKPATAPVWIALHDGGAPDPDAASVEAEPLEAGPLHAVVAAQDPSTGAVTWRTLQAPLTRQLRRARARLQARPTEPLPGDPPSEDEGDEAGVPATVELTTPLWRRPQVQRLLAVAHTPGPRRWSTLIRHHLDAGETDPARALLHQALHLDRDRACVALLAGHLWAAGRPRRAHHALVHALSTGALSPEDRTAWCTAVQARADALADPAAEAAAVETELGAWLDALDTPEAPEPLPTPPASLSELWLGALAALRRWDDADAVAADLGHTPRDHQVLAALRTTQAHPGAARAWHAAAVAWRADDRPDQARSALSRALALSDATPDHWLAAAWAWVDGRPDEARTHWFAALEVDPDGHLLTDTPDTAPHLADPDGAAALRDPAALLGPDGWRALAEAAETHLGGGDWGDPAVLPVPAEIGAHHGEAARAPGHRLAARAWSTVAASRPEDRRAPWAAAAHLAALATTQSTGPERALALLEPYAEALARAEDDATAAAAAEALSDEGAPDDDPADDDAHPTPTAPDPSPGPARAWLAVARWRGADGGVEALRQALLLDGLNAATLDAVLHHAPEVPVDAATRRWWRHLQRAVLGGDAPETRADGPLATRVADGPATPLTRQALAALHPGSSAWWHRLIDRLDPTTAPDADPLTRGLDRLELVAPEAHAHVVQLAQALQIGVPRTHVYRGAGAWGLAAWPTRPEPVLLVGHDHLDPDHPRHLDPAALRFAIAIELAHLAAGHPLLRLDQSVVGTSRSMYGVFGRYAGTAEGVVDLLTLLPGVDQLSKVQRLVRMTRRVSAVRATLDTALQVFDPLLSQLDPAGPTGEGVGREGWDGASLALRLHADRIALVLVPDLGAAARAILATSSSSAVHAEAVTREGLAAVLSETPGAAGGDGPGDDAPALQPDEAVRLASLYAFAVEHGAPDEPQDDDAPEA